MDVINNFIHTFVVFHINSFYSILFFLKNNFLFMFVLFVISYMVFSELEVDSYNYVEDERRML